MKGIKSSNPTATEPGAEMANAIASPKFIIVISFDILKLRDVQYL